MVIAVPRLSMCIGAPRVARVEAGVDVGVMVE
jgi:hypothetical protein